MEIVKRYDNCTAQAVFKTIVEQFIKDYVDNTGQVITSNALTAGVSYQKTFGKNNQQQMSVQIDNIVENQCYAVSIFSNRGVSQMVYELADINEGVEIRYTELYYPKNKWYAWNHKALFWIMKKQMARIVSAQLDALVTYTKNNHAIESK